MTSLKMVSPFQVVPGYRYRVYLGDLDWVEGYAVQLSSDTGDKGLCIQRDGWPDPAAAGSLVGSTIQLDQDHVCYELPETEQ